MKNLITTELPPFIKLVNDSGNLSLHVTKDFKKSEVLFTNSILKVYKKNLFLKINDLTLPIDLENHAINRKTHYDFFYFDSFTNHSCDPNTEMRYLTEETYEMVALRDIFINEEITNDYTTFNEYNPIRFNCWCKSKNCKLII